MVSRQSTRKVGVKSYPRNSRTATPPGSLGETTKILIGGLLAFPIAYLLVFWVFQQDPLNLGPAISRVAPFAVPAKLRGPELEESEAVKGEDEAAAAKKKQDLDILLDSEQENSLPIPDVDPDKIGPIEFD